MLHLDIPLSSNSCAFCLKAFMLMALGNVVKKYSFPVSYINGVSNKKRKTIKNYNVPVCCVTHRLKAKRRKALLIGE